MVESAKVPDKDTVWLGVFDQAKKAGFAGLLNSGRGEIGRNIRSFANGFHGGAEAAKILEIEVKEIRGFGEKGFGLGRVAAKNGQF